METDAQVGFLKERQCDQMQGYYFSKPVPGEQFAQLLRDGKTLEQRGYRDLCSQNDRRGN